MATIDIYDKGQVDTLLSGKADAASVPSVTNGSVTLAVVDWVSDAQSVTITGITGKIIMIGPAPASTDDYIAAGIRITAQSGDVLTFEAVTTPTAAITVDYVVIG